MAELWELISPESDVLLRVEVGEWEEKESWGEGTTAMCLLDVLLHNSCSKRGGCKRNEGE
jgi:hypothetical protein